MAPIQYQCVARMPYWYALAAPAHEFERAQVRGEEGKARDPSRHLASGEEEVFAGLGEALE